MKRTLLKNCLCLLILFFGFSATNLSYAVPATPNTVLVKQADGTSLRIKIYGDEFFSWRTTVDGQVIGEKNGNYYYVDYSIDGKMTFTPQKVTSNKRGLNERAFLAKRSAPNMSVIASSASTARRMAMFSNKQKTAYPSEGNVKSLVILVEFNDAKFTVANPQMAFTNQLNQEGYSVEGAVGSAKDYYLANSNGKFKPTFDVVGPFTLSRDMAYYGARWESGDDIRARDMIVEAVTLADPTTDFSQYDMDGDGIIDNVFVYYAGYNEAEGAGSDTIWPHKWYVEGYPVYDGKKLFAYACTSERRVEGATIAGIGTFCHEFSHVLGLSDHYDTDGAKDGQSFGLGDYDVMTSGSYNNEGNSPPMFNGLEKILAGWVEPIEFSGKETIKMSSIKDNVVYKIPTEVDGEYFLIENRQQDAIVWDKFIPSSGLIITHVDRSDAKMPLWDMNKPNNSTSHECFKLVVASGKILGDHKIFPEDWKEVTYPYGENKDFSETSVSPARSWDGKLVKYQLTDIKQDADKTVTFTVGKMDAKSLKGKIVGQDGWSIFTTPKVKLLKNETIGRSVDGNIINGEIVSVGTWGDTGYQFESVPEGNYILMAEADTYATYTATIYVSMGTEHDIVMTTLPQSNYSVLKYHNGNFKETAGIEGLMFRGYIKFSAEQMRPFIGGRFATLKYYAPAKFLGMAFFGNGLFGGGVEGQDKIFFGQPIEITDDSMLGWKTIDITGHEGGKFVEDGKDYYFQIQYNEGYDPINPPMALDNSASLEFNGLGNGIVAERLLLTDAYELSGGTIKGNLLAEIHVDRTTINVPKPTTAELSQTELTLAVNFKANLNFVVAPEEANPYAKWESENTAIVEVDQDGNLVALREGTVVITATSVVDESIVKTCEVTVTASVPATIKGKLVKYNDSAASNVEFSLYAQDVNSVDEIVTRQRTRMASQSDFKAAAMSPNLNSIFVTKNTKIDAKSDVDGNYEIPGLISGLSYMMNFPFNPIVDEFETFSKETKVLSKGENNLEDINIGKNPIFGLGIQKYHDYNLDASFGLSSPITYGVKITKDMLKDNIGDSLTYVDLYIPEMLDIERFVNINIFDLNYPIDFGANQAASFFRLPEEPVTGYFRIYLAKMFTVKIKAETDYLIAVTLVGSLAMDNTAASADGFGNLLFTDDGFIPASDISPDFTGNWVFSAFFAKGNILPMETVSIKYEGEEPTEFEVGAGCKLISEILPVNTSYWKTKWISSNKDIATVDEDGNVEFVGAGSVTITSESLKYEGVKGSKVFNVVLNQRVRGVIKNRDNNPIADAKVSFRLLKQDVRSAGEFSAMKDTPVDTKSEPIMAVSDEEGNYSAIIPVGRYRMEIVKLNYSDYNKSIDISKGVNILDIEIANLMESMSTSVTWAVDNIDDNHIGAAGKSFYALSKWEGEDIELHLGSTITQVKAHLAAACSIRFIVFGDDIEAPYYTSGLIQVTESGIVEHLLPTESYVLIEENHTYHIGYELVAYDETLFPSSLNTSATDDNKGNILYSNESYSTVMSVMGSEIGLGNFLISFNVQTQDQIKGISVQAGQKDALIRWNPSTYTAFKLGITKDGDTTPTEYSVEGDSKYLFKSLEVNTQYTVIVRGSLEADGEYVNIETIKFKTLPKNTDIPMIYVENRIYNEGEELLLRVYNTNDGDVVEWFVNDVVTVEEMLDIETGVSYKLKAEVTRGNTVFVIVKNVNVPIKK